MSYEPTLIIRKKDLDKALPILEEKEQYSKKEETAKVAKYLLNVSKSEVHKFDKLELILCTPEGGTFNNNVRNKLTKLNVDFRQEA